MSGARRTIGALLAAFLAMASARPATAFVEPSRAEADVKAAMHDSNYAFCSKPREPLSFDAQALCPHASSIPACEGFAAACARLAEPPPSLDLPPWLLRSVGWLLHWTAWLVKWVLLPGLVVLLLTPVVRALLRLRRDRRLAEPDGLQTAGNANGRPAEPEPMTDEQALLGRAEERARRGEYAAALELYLAASLRALDKRGAIALSKDRTNGEYVRACAEPDAKPKLRTLVGEVDRVQFGREAPTEDATRRAAATATAIVRGLATTLAALALVGCGNGGRWAAPTRAGEDPAGRELLVDLLHRQGVRTESLDGALASLPMPAPNGRAPAVVVDADRTEIDDETRAHLVEWVEAGGSLVLAGSPHAWPRELGVRSNGSTGPHHITARRLLSRGAGGAREADEEVEDEEEPDKTPTSGAGSGPVYAAESEHGELAVGPGLRCGDDGEPVAWFDDTTAYAVVVPRGKGWVLGIASDELFTNAALARPGNAAAALAILSNADRTDLRLAQPEDGVSPPSTPLAALQRAGLGLGLVHALVAALALFLAVGVRLARATPEPLPLRRAFVEHVEAVGALYRRTGLAAHALAAYARFADQRLRARMPRGTADVPAFLASRARLPLDLCQRVWGRAMGANQEAPAGDELEVLKELGAVYSAATDQDR